MSSKKMNSLYDRYPHLFSSEMYNGNKRTGFYFEHDDGWYDIIVEAFDAITNYLNETPDADPVHFGQIKEKFGTLRMYTEYTTDDTVRQIIRQAERRSGEICEVCGKPGETEDNSGWFKTVCSEHAAERNRK